MIKSNYTVKLAELKKALETEVEKFGLKQMQKKQTKKLLQQKAANEAQSQKINAEIATARSKLGQIQQR